MHDERGLVGRAAITILALIVVVGLAGIDGGSILLAKLQISDTADAAAMVAASTFDHTHNVNDTKAAAVEAAHERDPNSRVTYLSVSQAGAVTVTVRKVASTLFSQHIGFLRKLAVVTSTATESP